MKKIKKDVFGDGYTVYDANGAREHFSKNVLDDGYTSDKGTHVDPHFFDGGFSVRGDESSETFHKNVFNDDYSGSEGTTICKNVIETGSTVYRGNGGGNVRNTGGINSLSDIGGIVIAAGIGSCAMLLPFFMAGWSSILPSLSMVSAFLVIWLLKKRVSLTLLFLWSQPLICLGWFRLSTLLWDIRGDLDRASGAILGFLGIAMIALILMAVSGYLCNNEWGVIYIIPYGFLWINSLSVFNHSYGYGCIGILFAIAAIPTLITYIKNNQI